METTRGSIEAPNKRVKRSKTLTVSYPEGNAETFTYARANNPQRVTGERLVVRIFSTSGLMELRHITGTFVKVKELSPARLILPMDDAELMAYAERILSSKGRK